MVCKNCGKDLKEKEKFCTFCGTYNDYDEDDDSLDINNSPKEEQIYSGNGKSEYLIDDDEIQDNEKNEEKDYVEEKNLLDDDDFPIKEENDDFSIIESQLKSEIKDFKLNKKEEKKVVRSKMNNNDPFNFTPKQKEFDYELEQYIEPFIGEDYKIIKKSLINIYALLLSWIYVIYRKLYITGIIGLIVTFILLVKNPIICLIFIGLSMIILGLVFNKYYQIVSTIKVKRILKETNETDSFKLKEICRKKGGVNVAISLIAFSIFIFLYLIIVIGIPKFNHISKYYSETSENQANCISISKQTVKDYFKNRTGEIVTEATCRVIEKEPKQFNIILKISANKNIYYLYYLADGRYLTKQIDTIDMKLLEEKKANKTITSYEERKLLEQQSIISEYQIIVNKSKEEDKLLEAGKEKGPKKNFIVDKEEIMR